MQSAYLLSLYIALASETNSTVDLIAWKPIMPFGQGNLVNEMLLQRWKKPPHRQDRSQTAQYYL